MTTTCGCEATRHAVRCAECGTLACPACTLRIGARALCGACGTTQPAVA